ncbi:MAG TPA: transglycosylase SLT domain-containing protein [Pyrinomonadaceae bacterium]|jgi:soluble lytic murein transglycosylase|nr:transglycosylase SLT domain-containing protein [Pyrinomonadaceae bacterium]
MKLSKIARQTPLDLLGLIFLIACAISSFVSSTHAQKVSDVSLDAVRASDRIDRLSKAPPQLTAAEHLRRANVYMANRAFPEARQHFQAILDNYPNDPNVPAAIYGIGRSLYIERHYEDARQMFERVAQTYPDTKEGREGSNFAASSLLRMGRGAEAAARYAQYIDKYPNGERVDSAHLNVIDGYRESGHPQDAIAWIEKTRQRFAGTPTETSAVFARLRLDIALGDWNHATQTADELLSKAIPTASNTSPDEVLYLKAHALERAGRTQDAIRFFAMIPDNADSYYGGLATNRLAAINDAAAHQRASERSDAVRSAIDRAATAYPAPFRFQVLSESKKRALDPRLVLAIMKQESQFKPNAKSPSAARGLLQLTIDAAQKYGPRAGFKQVTDDSLYQPGTNIALGTEYIAELSRMFAGLAEAIAASYNGGEDNVARWLGRSNQSDAGVFTAEVGFTESKNYVFKVMSFYRAYRQLYDSNLNRR